MLSAQGLIPAPFEDDDRGVVVPIEGHAAIALDPTIPERKIRTLWEWRHVPDMAANLKNELRYPLDLPRLNRRQPNSRRQNINMSHSERHHRGELPETYY